MLTEYIQDIVIKTMVISKECNYCTSLVWCCYYTDSFDIEAGKIVHCHLKLHSSEDWKKLVVMEL